MPSRVDQVVNVTFQQSKLVSVFEIGGKSRQLEINYLNY
jgi:hypothetical protein